MENRNHQVLLKRRPTGAPTPADFEIAEAPLPEPREGEVLVRGIFLSLDPYMRGRISGQRSYARPVEVGAVMEGRVVGKVAHSRDPNFREGDYVLGGFRTVATPEPSMPGSTGLAIYYRAASARS